MKLFFLDKINIKICKFFFKALGSNAPIVPTKILGDPVELDRHLIENGYIDTQQQPPPSNNYTTRYILNEQNDIQLHVSD